MFFVDFCLSKNMNYSEKMLGIVSKLGDDDYI
jgi:hypothetical protein